MQTSLDEQIRQLMDAGVRPVPAAEITSRGVGHVSRPPARTNAAWRSSRFRLVVTTSVAAAVLGCGTAVGIQLAGPTDHHPEYLPPNRTGLILTAAAVRQLAAASRAALAHSGVARIAYRTRGGPYSDFGTDEIAFSGHDYNFVGKVTTPAADGQPARTQSYVNRVVKGQAYDHFVAADGLRWYHVIGRDAVARLHVPDPRGLLRAIAPSARLRFEGWQVVDGIRLRRLRATALTGLSFLAALPEAWPGDRVTALVIWVDKHRVVRRMAISLRQKVTVWSIKIAHHRGHLEIIAGHHVVSGTFRVQTKGRVVKENLRRLLRQAEKSGAVAKRTETAVTILRVSFTAIGKPQHISVPPHAITVTGRG